MKRDFLSFARGVARYAARPLMFNEKTADEQSRFGIPTIQRIWYVKRVSDSSSVKKKAIQMCCLDIPNPIVTLLTEAETLN